MKLLEAAAIALGCLAAGLFTSAVWHPSAWWPGVCVAALCLVAVLAFSGLEHLAAQRRAVTLEAWETRFAALEAKEAALRTEVDTLNRERALSRM